MKNREWRDEAREGEERRGGGLTRLRAAPLVSAVTLSTNAAIASEA